MNGLIGLLIVFGVVAVLVGGSYNGLVRLRNETRNAWSQIDVQLKRRHNLIPNLVETVKGYAAHEKETLENVTAARSQAAGATGVADQAQAESGLTAALGRLMVVVEQYPDLKANTNFMSLQEELTSTENRIGFSRQHYNDSVLQYNNRIESVPSNFVAGLFQFSAAEFFEIVDEEVRQVPKVQF